MFWSWKIWFSYSHCLNISSSYRAATVEIPKPPPNKTLKAIAFRKELSKKKEAEEMQNEIAAFEQQLSRSLADAEEDK